MPLPPPLPEVKPALLAHSLQSSLQPWSCQKSCDAEAKSELLPIFLIGVLPVHLVNMLTMLQIRLVSIICSVHSSMPRPAKSNQNVLIPKTCSLGILSALSPAQMRLVDMLMPFQTLSVTMWTVSSCGQVNMEFPIIISRLRQTFMGGPIAGNQIAAGSTCAGATCAIILHASSYTLSPGGSQDIHVTFSHYRYTMSRPC